MCVVVQFTTHHHQLAKRAFNFPNNKNSTLKRTQVKNLCANHNQKNTNDSQTCLFYTEQLHRGFYFSLLFFAGFFSLGFSYFSIVNLRLCVFLSVLKFRTSVVRCCQRQHKKQFQSIHLNLEEGGGGVGGRVKIQAK